MPLYSYRCTSGHETEGFFSFAGRPFSVPCASCGENATFYPSISKHVGVMGTVASTELRSRGNAQAFKGLALHYFRCQCGEEFDDFVDFSENEKTSDGKPCPKCGEMARWVPALTIDRSSERFPYFDRGLGIMVQSKQHRREICANPRKYGIDSDGLTPVDGDWDTDRAISNYSRKIEEDLRGYDEYVDRLENHPGFASYRRARDQGRV